MTSVAFPVPDLKLYGGTDIRDQPLYSYADVARATRLPVSTVRAWVTGTTYGHSTSLGYFAPVLSHPDDSDSKLSFFNVVEIHVLHALRSGTHRVPMPRIREAIQVAAQRHGAQRPLLHPNLATVAGKVFLDDLTTLLDLSNVEQLAMRTVLADSVRRIGYDPDLPIEFYPFSRFTEHGEARLIVINPFVSFGRAVVRRLGVSTAVIAERIDAGEVPDLVKRDYDLADNEFEEALAYEAAA